MNIFFDVESAGLLGNTKLLQWSADGGPVQLLPLFQGWRGCGHTVSRLCGFLELVDRPDVTLIAFNAGFDLFHLYRLQHQLLGLPLESAQRPVLPLACRVLDLQVPAMLHSPLAPFAFQKSRSKSIARVRKIPAVALDILVPKVTEALQAFVPGELSVGIHRVAGAPHLRSVSWALEARISLKGLMKTYGIPTLALADVWPLPERGQEDLWLPYPNPAVHGPIEAQCDAVMRNPRADFWKYAELDILYLQVLYDKLGKPVPDHHSDCVHAVAYTRYYGFDLDAEVLQRTREHYAARVQAIEAALAGINLGSPKQRLEALRKLDPLMGSSAKKALQAATDMDRPCAPLAQTMLDYGPTVQRLRQVEKVAACVTGRAHPAFRVMGTRTGRMAGEAGLNWQGIGQAHGGLGIRAAVGAVAVGDWSQFEVALAAGIYPDAAMDEDLSRGNDAHCMTASLMHPEARKRGWDHDTLKELVARHDPVATRIRKASKAGTFGINYWAQAGKISEVFSLPLSEAQEALDNYYRRYKGFAAFRRAIESGAMTADTERWSRDSVARMTRSITDLTGFEMRWDFEAQVADVLWKLGGEGVRTGISGLVTRQIQKGPQTADNAIRSALLGAALAIQQAVARQMGNAAVQASGANINKILQARVWSRFRCPLMQIHDELVFARHPHFDLEGVHEEARKLEGEHRERVPHLFFDLQTTRTWSDK